MKLETYNSQITVTVICITYNHEDFIKDALEGFVNQITDFDYEVLIHDDCSTDNTADIIREYEEKYPNLIRPVYQKKNLYSQHIPIIETQLLPKVRGKYIAFCEGDDFWTDPYKLQKQVYILEKYKHCSMCFNTVVLSNVNGKSKGLILPPLSSNVIPGEIESKKLQSLIAYPGAFHHLFIQLSGCMFRTELYQSYIQESPIFKSKFGFGDLPLFFYMAAKGDGFYIDEKMSVYRTENPNSWVGNISKTRENKLLHAQRSIEGLKAFDEYSNHIIHNEILKAIKNREFYQMRAAHDIKSMKSDDMKELYNLLSFSTKIKEHLFHFLPFLEQFWLKIRYYKCINLLRSWVQRCQEQKITKKAE
jgi:glycosyltransferase involved in cell wall biosynthesis